VNDALSPLLFNLALEKVVRTMPAFQEMEILGESTILTYVDEVIAKTDGLLKVAKPMGLKDNQDKTKYIVVIRSNGNIA